MLRSAPISHNIREITSQKSLVFFHELSLIHHKGIKVNEYMEHMKRSPKTPKTTLLII